MLLADSELTEICLADPAISLHVKGHDYISWASQALHYVHLLALLPLSGLLPSKRWYELQGSDRCPIANLTPQDDPKPTRVDIHHHIFPASIGKAALSMNVGWQTPAENLPWTPEVSLEAMDKLGIRLAVLSMPAGLPAGPVGHENRQSAREFNCLGSQISVSHPGRFAFFACMPNLFDTQGKPLPLSFLEAPISLSVNVVSQAVLKR